MSDVDFETFPEAVYYHPDRVVILRDAYGEVIAYGVLHDDLVPGDDDGS